MITYQGILHGRVYRKSMMETYRSNEQTKARKMRHMVWGYTSHVKENTVGRTVITEFDRNFDCSRMFQ